MQNMKARNMEELSENLKEVADSIKEGYHTGMMRPGCTWKIEGEEEPDEEEKVFRFTFKSEVFIKSRSKDEAEEKYQELKVSISHGWLSLKELVESNIEEGFVEGEVLHYNDISRKFTELM